MAEIIDPLGNERSIGGLALGVVAQARQKMEARQAFIFRVANYWFEYEPETGLVRWKRKPSGIVRVGQIAGRKSKNGKNTYIRIKVEGKDVLAHQIAYVIHTGTLPNGPIDHENGDGTDNRFVNIRVTSFEGNAKNKRLDQRNASGVMGVSFLPRIGKWRARIGSKKKLHHIGNFDTREQAIAARLAAERDHGFHSGHGRKK
ncbi:HNH endonuclease [Rhizobiales bacterium RZME27]|uniref:HNH endonuclease n=1 Tax=Endobacterium cereale TaxID=2663029 RepID=A0A6A8AAK5_9HYPH|nr:HNH endonuclease [Endobacterium cereale]MQY48232.1 HNH endonuclease [Endobacterium cereale]